MVLSKSVADQIVSQLSKIVEQHINIMDIEGKIISSTDVNRINSFHGGAVKIINERLSELMIFSDDEYAGAKNGINLPIHFNDEIVGVIGMTGTQEEVYKYGQIIKKMTEILLLEFSLREQYIIEQKAKDRFLEEWVFGRFEGVYPNEFQIRAQRLGIDVKTPKRILAFSIRSKDLGFIDDQMQTQISHKIRNYFKTIPQAFLFRTSTLFIGVLNHCRDEEMLEIAKEIEKVVTKDYNCYVYMGIDHSQIKSIYQSFKNANAAHRLSLRTNQQIEIYDALNIDLYITRMATKDREAYIENLFPNLGVEEIAQMIDLLRIFYEENGSIDRSSQRLFIHKNTLQYRIQKIINVTKRDPRKLRDAHVFSVAIRIFDTL